MDGKIQSVSAAGPRQAEIRLSCVREGKGYVIYVHNGTEKTLALQRWFKGKRGKIVIGLGTVNSDAGPGVLELPQNSRYGYAFTGGSFHVRHAGVYTVHVVFQDGSKAGAEIQIGKVRAVAAAAVVPLLVALGTVAAYTAANGRGAAKSPAVSLGSGPDTAAGYGLSGPVVSETASQIQADLKARQNRTTITLLSTMYGSAGSTEGAWSFANTDTNIVKQAVVYEADVSEQTVNGKRIMADTPTQKLGETPVVGPGQHSETVRWFAPLSGGTRTVCAFVYYYNPQTNVRLGSSFVQNLTLQIS